MNRLSSQETICFSLSPLKWWPLCPERFLPGLEVGVGILPVSHRLPPPTQEQQQIIIFEGHVIRLQQSRFQSFTITNRTPPNSLKSWALGSLPLLQHRWWLQYPYMWPFQLDSEFPDALSTHTTFTPSHRPQPLTPKFILRLTGNKYNPTITAISIIFSFQLLLKPQL